jgi:protein O-GlcNAc transferase
MRLTVRSSLLMLLALCISLPASAAVTSAVGMDGKATLSIYKQSSYYHLQAGSRLSDAEKYDESVPYFEKAVEDNPTSVLAEYNLGYSLMQAAEKASSPQNATEKLRQAEWAFLRVRDLNPDLTFTYYKLGKLAMMRDDYKTAAAYYQSGVDNDPDNYALHFNLAATYEKINDLKHAERAYLNAIKANPRFVYAHNNLGLLYEQQDQPKKAEAVYKEALNQVPEYNYARLNLGSLLQADGRLEEAQQVYEDAIQYEPDNAWAHLYLGNTYYRKGNYEAALDSYNKAITLNPKYPTTYYLASLALQKLNRNDEALANGLHYINLAPNGAFSQEAGELVMSLQHAKKRASSDSKVF